MCPASFFPRWVIVIHFLNIFFLLLASSGRKVLAAHPKLYVTLRVR